MSALKPCPFDRTEPKLARGVLVSLAQYHCPRCGFHSPYVPGEIGAAMLWNSIVTTLETAFTPAVKFKEAFKAPAPLPGEKVVS